MSHSLVFACDECPDRGFTREGLVSYSKPRAKPVTESNPAQVNEADPLKPCVEDLAARSQSGCLESFEQLVHLYENRIFNFLYQFTRHRQDAEDLAQVTFLRAYRSLARYNPALAFAPWLFTIARRTAQNHFRSAQRFEELPADDAVVGVDPAALLASVEEQNSIWRMARRLKPRQFEVLWLRFGDGFTIAEAARIMGVTQLHVKVLQHRARAQLAKWLAQMKGSP